MLCFSEVPREKGEVYYKKIKKRGKKYPVFELNNDSKVPKTSNRRRNRVYSRILGIEDAHEKIAICLLSPRERPVPSPHSPSDDPSHTNAGEGWGV
jgi:hypothetical protein